MRSHVYLIHCPHTDAVKIGISHSPKRRIATLQSSRGFSLVLIKTWPFSEDMARLVEQTSHWDLDEFRLLGEWFKCSVDVALCSVERRAALMPKHPKFKVPRYSRTSIHLGAGPI